ncbi:hypothetical protein [Atrimonas thermophila]|uniref:hypothetical protein n=1 Tax=Atrimonas thermophila TaxID=3064161 RepID=UPI00399CF69C
MKYIDEINAFQDWAEVNSCSPSARLLWFALFHVNNRGGWMVEFTVPLSKLEALTGLSRSQICNARNELAQRGLLYWRRNGGRASATYILIPFTDDEEKRRRMEYIQSLDSNLCPYFGRKIEANVKQNEIKREANVKQTKIETTSKPGKSSAPAGRKTKTKTKTYTSLEDISNDISSKEGEPAVADINEVNNREIIVELTKEYRSIPGILPEKGDFAFIGSLYNHYGYTAVLDGIAVLRERVTAGFTPEKPKVYLLGIIKRSGPAPAECKPEGGEADEIDKLLAERTRKYAEKGVF